jgi:sensor c-di-GMP phosphodiesterase-like protein
MGHTLRQQSFIGHILIALLVLSGSVAGYVCGRQAVIWESLRKLDQYAALAVAQNDASLGEASKALESQQHSWSSGCGDEEIEELRDIVFRSAYLKDAGRIQDGRIVCSASAGHSVQSISALGADASHTKTGFTYYSLKDTAKAGQNRAALQFGNAFVVVDSGVPLHQGAGPVQLAVTTSESANPHAASRAGSLTNALVQGITWRIWSHPEKNLNATRCSTLGFNCITLSISTAFILEQSNLAVAASAAVGAMSGLLLGMLFINAQSRGHDLPSQLRRALDHDKLEVVYQPIVNLATQMIIGAEALSRLTKADGEAVDPDVFVKIAEEQGFVGKLTRLVLRRVLHDFATTLQNRPGFRISMNVAAADLSDPTFLPMMDEALERANVKPESIVIEITERSAADGDVAMETIRELRRRGFAIHIDDFGTGYSNLDKLLYLFADTIKIDKAFTHVIGTESVAVAILPQILDMAKNLGLGVVVEGVETQAQSDYFNPGKQKIHAQGWLYGRPGTAEALKSMLANNERIAPIQEEIAQEVPIEVPALSTHAGSLHLVKSRIA